jgi:hypothetical protein
MPETRQDYGTGKTQNLAGSAAPGAANSHIGEIAQPVGQGDMPAPPEFDKAGGPVRRTEVFRQPQTYEKGCSDGYIRISGKILLQNIR